jgi:hypothetical protein
MGRHDSLHRIWLTGGLVLLALCVLALVTQAKTAQYSPDHHLTTQCKATDATAGSKLKVRLAAGAAGVAGAPVRLEVPVFQPETVSPALEFFAPAPAPLSAANLLRAPPAL